MTYDLVIIGAGAGGLTSALYAVRYGLKTAVVSKDFGGLTATADEIMNCPGVCSVTGQKLMQDFKEQVEKKGAEIKYSNVSKISKVGNNFSVETDSGNLEGKKVIFATGTEHKHLGVPGKDEFRGKGVSYCATCDGMFYQNKIAAIVGGSDSAAKEALLLSEHCSKVYVIYRREKLRAEPINYDRIMKKVDEGKIELIYNTKIIIGDTNRILLYCVVGGYQQDEDGAWT